MTIKVDLLPTEKKRFGIDPVWIFLVLVIILFTVGFFVYGKSLETAISTKEQDVKKVETEINDLRGKLPNIAKMKAENDKLGQQINTIKGLKNDPVRYANLLWEIADIMPSNVWVNSINIEPGQQAVTMTGQAINFGGARPLESIAQTMRAFQNSRYFKDATLSSTASMTWPPSYTGFSFQLETHYDPDLALKSPDQIQPRGTASGAPGAAPSGAPAPGAKPSAAPATAPSSAPAAPASAAPAASGAPASAPSGAPSAAPSGNASGAPAAAPSGAASGSPASSGK